MQRLQRADELVRVVTIDAAADSELGRVRVIDHELARAAAVHHVHRIGQRVLAEPHLASLRLESFRLL